MDLSTIRDEITDRVGPGTGLSATTLNRWINDGQRLFCSSFEFPWLEATDTDTTVDGTQNYNIPSDCRKLLAVYVNDEKYTYVPFTQKDNVPTGGSANARAYYVFDDDIYLIPTPDSATAGETIDFFISRTRQLFPVTLILLIFQQGSKRLWSFMV